MASSIYYRARVKTKEGSRTPRYRIVAVSGADLKVFADHFRKKELEQIAKSIGAELVELERDKDAKVK